MMKEHQKCKKKELFQFRKRHAVETPAEKTKKTRVKVLKKILTNVKTEQPKRSHELSK